MIHLKLTLAMARTQAAIAYIPTVVRELAEQLRRLRDDVGMRSRRTLTPARLPLCLGVLFGI